MPQITRENDWRTGLRERLRRLRRRLKVRNEAFVLIMAAVIGVAAGLGAVAFRFLIVVFEELFFGVDRFTDEAIRGVPLLQRLAAPALGLIIVTWITRRWSREARGTGIPEVMEAVINRSGAIRPRVAAVKSFVSALTIGAGGSVGREGPVVQIGAAVGSTLGQWFEVSALRVRTFVGCGAAAGIAAAFNAPIAGALFSVEIILGDFGFTSLAPIVISSVAAVVVSRHFEASLATFQVTPYHLGASIEMLSFALLGVVTGVLAALFIKSHFAVERVCLRLGERTSDTLRAAAGGLFVGALGLAFPEILGVGYGAVNLALAGKLTLTVCLVLAALKMLATSVTLGSGGSGGIFAPSLFIGALAGLAFGKALNLIAPGLSPSPEAYALVGMAAFVSGTTHAPITAIMIVFELTGNFELLPPLMAASILALLVNHGLTPYSIYAEKLRRRGVDLYKGMGQDVMKSLSVREAMLGHFDVIPRRAGFHDIVETVMKSNHKAFPVVDDEGRLAGVIGLADIREAILDEDVLKELVVAADIAADAPVVTPEDGLDKAVELLVKANAEELAVVDPEDRRRLVGMVRREDIIDLYHQLVLRREMAKHMASSILSSERRGMADLADGYVIQEIEAPRSFWGRTLAELQIRGAYRVEVVAIRRPAEGGKRKDRLAPTAAETIREGDSLLVMGELADVRRVGALA